MLIIRNLKIKELNLNLTELEETTNSIYFKFQGCEYIIIITKNFILNKTSLKSYNNKLDIINKILIIFIKLIVNQFDILL